MLQSLVVWFIVLGAAFFVGRRLYRTLSGRSSGCCEDGGCGTAGCSPDPSRCSSCAVPPADRPLAPPPAVPADKGERDRQAPTA